MRQQDFLTKEKKKELEKELEYLKSDKRKEIIDRLAFAKSLGDLSENAEYHDAKEEQGKNEARITQIESILKSAVTITKKNDGFIDLGSTVFLLKKGAKDICEYQIVGNEESDFSLGKISFESPLGAALMGKKQGDKITVSSPKGETIYNIKDVK
ncbi:MAG: transcription elongation factor GreA [Candidatus Pacebacteria bacterium]|nr:transcription elongation factor GreA [Candidatus Paceibacterota bacterium]